MPRRVGIVAVALGFVITAAACSSGPSPAATGSSSHPSTAPASSTAPTTTAPVAIVGAGSGQEAASAFVSAWRNGDRDAALAIALPAAVDAVFSAGDPGSVQNRGCNTPPVDSPVLCVYKTTPGELQVRATQTPIGWIVDQAQLSPAG